MNCCGPSGGALGGGPGGIGANQAKANATAGGPTPVALDPGIAANAAKAVSAGGPGAAQGPNCCAPGAACCKPDAACCTPTGQTAGIGLDNFNGAPAPTNPTPVQGGGPGAASAPLQANGLGDVFKRLQEMIAQLGKRLGVNFG